MFVIFAQIKCAALTLKAKFRGGKKTQQITKCEEKAYLNPNFFSTFCFPVKKHKLFGTAKSYVLLNLFSRGW